MIRTLCILCLFYLAAPSAAAQHKKFRWPKRPVRTVPVVIPPKPGLIIHTNLFSLHELEAGPSLGFEYRASLHFSVGVEGTALLYTFDNTDNGRGFRIQPEVRYWFAGRHRTFRGFFSLQATYKERRYRDSALIGIGSPFPGIPGRQRVYFEEKKQVLAGAANIGFQKRFWNDRFMFEMYAGLGLKQKDFYGRPAEFIEENKGWFFPDIDTPGVYPHLAMGARIGYCF